MYNTPLESNSLSLPIKVIFKYCFEIDHVARREDSYTIIVEPTRVISGIQLVFTKESIIKGLEKDNLDRYLFLAVKYYDGQLRSWIDLPEELSITIDILNENGESPQIVELLVREGAREARRGSQPRIQNSQIWPRERTNVNELEKELSHMKERISSLEQKLEEQILQQALNRIAQIASPQNEENVARNDRFLIQNVEDPQSQDALLPELKSNQTSRHKYICHQCHSDIVRDNSKGSINKNYSRLMSQEYKNNSELGSKKQSKHAVRSDSISGSNHRRTVDQDDSSGSCNEFPDTDSHLSYEFNDFQRMSSDHNNHVSYSHQDSSPLYMDKFKPLKRKLDLAYLYSDPLAERKKDGQLVPINQPLDTDTELREIQKILHNSKKTFLLRKEAVNFETLKQVLVKQPKIIHISCHGDYDEEFKQFYLAFEEKDSGLLDKLTEDRLGKLLGEDAHHKVHLVFVSACHSEMIGKIFLRAKIPVVVAVNSHSLILDEVCQLFARHFYCYLLDGYSPKIAFYEAQKVVQGSKIEKYSCCCAHDHKPDCKWQKYAMKYGYEKAHELHTPNCQCTYQHNNHRSNCKFYKEFISELQEFEDLMMMDFDESAMPSYNGTVKVCCCQPSLPHDESIKFVLNGTDSAINEILFENRQEGQLVIDADVNQHNKLPQVIDNQMLVGRNKELQQVVAFLFSDLSAKRLIHIYGCEGVGKSAIAKYAAKYTLDRRKFPDGVYYVEVQNRNSGQGLVSKICQKLMIPNCTKEQLCDIIKTNHILIILDKCKKLIEQSKSSFNKTLKEIIENTTFAKILVVSRDKQDITDDVRFKVQIEVGELSKLNAAKLLILAAGGSKNMKQHQNPKELQNHQIFNHLSFKPSGILQMAPLLYEKTLDQIVKEKELEVKRAQDSVQLQENQSNQREYGEFSWIMSISYRDLESKFHLELNLLYLLCQAPAGLSESDIEFICTEKPSLYGDWQKFLNAIISKDKSNSIEPEPKLTTSQIQKKNQLLKKDKYKSFSLISSNFSEELQENHYIPQPIVSEYINSLVLKFAKKTVSFQECFRYLSKLSRRLLRSIKIQKNKEIDVYQVSAEIDIGIWSDSMTTTPISQVQLEQQMVYNAEVKFAYNESNFIGFLDLDLLKSHFETLDYKNVFSQYLDELCMNTSSILLMLNREDEAIQLIDKCKQICNIYDLRYIKAKILIIQSSVLLKMNVRNYEITRFLDQAEQIFMDLNIDEGTSEALFLKALTIINDIKGVNMSHQAYQEHSFSGTIGTHSHHFERSNSQEMIIHDQRFNPLSHQSSHSTPTHHNFSSQTLVQKSANMYRKAETILQCLSRARKFFKQVNQEFGIAKTNLIESEFYIENSYGSGVPLEYDPKRIAQMLQDAIILFRKFGCESQVARCLRNLAELKYQMNENFDAKRHIEDALIIIKKLQDNHQEPLANRILNNILHKIRIQSHNVFIFAKAFPLVEVMSASNVRQVGQFTRYPSDFRRRLQDEIKKQKKVVNLKFDILTTDTLEYIKTYGCRVLHISSDVYNPDFLCIEGKNGEIEYLSIHKLKQHLRPAVGRLNVDVVVVAIPESMKIAQAFIDLGVPHVIGFDFKQKLLSTFMDNIYTLPKKYDYIYDFCVEFYKNLIQQKTIDQACKSSRPSLNEGIRKMNDRLGLIHLTKDDVGEGAILLPKEGKQKVKLFDSISDDERKQLKVGPFLDTSKVRGPTNVTKTSTPYTGRQIETHRVINAIKKSNIKILNVIGLDGIGKTRFLQETSYYMHARFQFQDGIFMLDLRRVKTSDQIKQKLKEINIGGGQSLDLNTNLQNKNILLIFDNIDSLLKHNKTQFDWWLMSLVQQCDNLKVLMTSKKEINIKNYQKLEKSIFCFKLKPLNDIEAVDMILSNCNRQITTEELLMSDDSKQSVHHQLQQEGSVKNCCGFPKYLQLFSQYLEIHSFDKINIKNYIPNTKRGQMKRLQKEYLPASKRTGAVKVNIIHENQNHSLVPGSTVQVKNYRKPDERPVTIEYQDRPKKSKTYDKSGRLKSVSQQIENQVIEEVEEDFTESNNTKHSRINKRFLGDEEEKKVRSNEEEKEGHSQQHSSFSRQSQMKDYDEEFFYSQSAKYQAESPSSRRRSSNMGKHISSSGGEDNELSNSGIVYQYTKDGQRKPYIIKNPKNSRSIAQSGLNKSEGGESSAAQINNFIRQKQNQNQDLYQSEYQVKPNTQQQQAEDDIVRYPSINNKNFKDNIQANWGRFSLMDAHAQLDQMMLEDDFNNIDKVEMFVPFQRTESVQSYLYDPNAEGRSRSNSGAFDSSQLKSSNYGISTDEPSLRKSEYQKKFKHSEVEEQQEEEDQTDSKVHSDVGEHYVSHAQQQIGESSCSKVPQLFNLEDANSVNSMELQDECEFEEDGEEQDDEDFDMSTIKKPMSKQLSVYTTSSGKKSDSINKGSLSMQYERQKSKKDKTLKEKLKAREEYGPRSSRHTKRYQKQTKNKFQQVSEIKYELRKQKKQMEKLKKADQLEKQIFEEPSQNKMEESTEPEAKRKSVELQREEFKSEKGSDKKATPKKKEKKTNKQDKFQE